LINNQLPDEIFSPLNQDTNIKRSLIERVKNAEIQNAICLFPPYPSLNPDHLTGFPRPEIYQG
jgi:hypothetical protein